MRYIVAEVEILAGSRRFFVIDTQSTNPGSGAGYSGYAIAECPKPSQAVALAATLNA